MKCPKSHVGTGFLCGLTDPDNPSELILNLKYFYILKTQIYPFEEEACPCQELVLGQERLLVGKGPAMYAGEAQFPLPTSS